MKIMERISLASIMAFLRRIFAKEPPPAAVMALEPPPAVVQQPEPAPEQPVTVAPKPKQRAPRRQRGASAKNLSALLDSLDNVFAALQLPPDVYSHMSPSEIKGIKASSPLVASLSYDGGVLRTVDTSAGLPGVFVVSTDDNLVKKMEKGLMAPDFIFGVKVKKVPWNVTRLPGVIYRFGLAWRSEEGKKHYWGTFWLAVQKDGSVRVAHELTNVNVPTSSGGYCRREWIASSWKNEERDAITPVLHVFCTALRVYQERKQKWNVAVRKGGARAIFLINQTDTPEYFKARDKTALTAQGKLRPIMHYVRPHTQKHGDKVVDIPEHIRGLRSFVWNGYECAITSPAFHTVLAADMDLAGTEYDEDEFTPELWSLEQMAKELADAEDYKQQRKQLRRRA